jgi:hypothetical protein
MAYWASWSDDSVAYWQPLPSPPIEVEKRQTRTKIPDGVTTVRNAVTGEIQPVCVQPATDILPGLNC